MAKELDYFRRDADHCVAAWGCVLIWFSVGPIGLDEAEKAAGYYEQMAERNPGGYCFALYAKDSCKLPNAAARAALTRTLSDQRGKMTAMAALFEGHGFFMSSSRAILSTMLALARQPFVSMVSGDIQEMAKWVCETMGLGRDSAELVAIYRQIAATQASLARRES